MKRRLLPFLCSILLAASLAGCTFSAAENVGTIGGVEISAGLYRLAQYDAYQQAAGLASGGQDTADVKNFLKQTIISDESGETALVSDYVAQKAFEAIEVYAAIETRFDELGGTLTAEQEAQATAYAGQLYEQYGSSYKANGIDLETLERFERILQKSSRLLALTYGENGPSPVSDEALTDYLQAELLYANYFIVPLYSTTTYAAATDAQKAQMLALAQEAVDQYKRSTPGTAEDQEKQFRAAVLAALPGICGVLGDRYAASESDFDAGLFNKEALQLSFPADGAADAIRALEPGEAAAVQYSGDAMIFILRLDAIEAVGLDTLRDDILREMKGGELSASLKAYGASLAHKLDENTIKKLPASMLVSS